MSKSNKSTSNLVKWFAIGLLCLVAYKVAIVFYHIAVIHNSELLFDFNSETMKKRGNVLHTCDIGHEHVRTVVNVHSFETAIKIIKDSGHKYPILFRNFIVTPEEDWKLIEDKHKDANLTFTDLKLHGFGNIWVAGSVSPGNTVELKLGEFFEESKKLPTDRALYAAFVKFVDSQYIGDKSAHSIQDSLNIKADTNFIANFPYDMIATSIHAAPLGNSYSIQYLGRKMWIFMSPDEMEEFEPICTPSTLLMKGSEAEFMTKKNKVTVAVQKEGDFLYFPANWGHAVITQKGPNVMLNLRETGIVTSFFNAPFRALEGLLSVVTTMSKRRIYSHTTLSPLQQALTFNPNITDSPCASQWKELLNN